MPDRGLRTIEGLAPEGFDAGPLVIEGRWLQLTFEVDRDAALRWMPVDVTRPIPCYGRLLVVLGEGERGRLEFAVLSVGGRFRMIPRNVLVEAVSVGSARLPALWGPLRSGEVDVGRVGEDFAVQISREGKLLVEASFPRPYAIDPAMLRWDGWVVYASEGGRDVLAEAPVEVGATAAWLSKGAAMTPARGLDRADPWYQLRTLLPISACMAEGRLAIGPAKVPAPMVLS
ncbi:hypothetical protein [Tepidiforma sp.]|uniref:hypothetical protein n=1 Tax=Tepidiforma sp. TaxID=2682230 RepID=UPI002ADE9184|nr:hypothetical protein [Tepidiforma sp.]